ncbi:MULTISPECIES: hypothetical protein [Streptomyces]|uniref:hypothetical protein n=1 Tax=Streptomyces TaxID=1883 RepID=UPI002248D00E|nr:hypothetical protein [Streptomyces sp. JHD 1]MCX2967277.1 hypothetical protein [Streptomyces sp. JHD 1]
MTASGAGPFAPAAPAPPSPGLIASLRVRAWLDHTVDGRAFAPVLITHPANAGDLPGVVEPRMRTVARALGARPAGAHVPDVGPRVIVRRGGLLVRFDGTPFVLRVAKPARWGTALAALGRALLVVGLDPLPARAAQPEVDAYLEHACADDRVHVAAAGVRVAGR